jgi:hypothetical protein
VFPGTGAASLNVLVNDSLGPDSDETLSIVDVTQPAHGIVSIAGGGWGLFYEAIDDYIGPDQFTYTISDDLGLTDTATVRVIVTTDPTPPIAAAPRVIISAGSGARASGRRSHGPPGTLSPASRSISSSSRWTPAGGRRSRFQRRRRHGLSERLRPATTTDSGFARRMAGASSAPMPRAV